MADFLLEEPDEPLTVDERLDAALAGVAPGEETETRLPFGRGWAFDFEQGKFVAHGTSPAAVSGYAQLATWIEKTLRTARFAHAIYSDDYGVDDPWQGIGFAYTPGLAAKLARSITDALTVHDRISNVTDFVFDGGGTSTLFISFRVVTDEDDEQLDFTIPFGRL